MLTKKRPQSTVSGYRARATAVQTKRAMPDDRGKAAAFSMPPSRSLGDGPEVSLGERCRSREMPRALRVTVFSTVSGALISW